MKTLFNIPDRKEVLDRLNAARPESERRWGSMSAHQMICHLSDSFRAALGESLVNSPLDRTPLFSMWIFTSPIARLTRTLPIIGLSRGILL